ncbi:MAG: alpha/beta fold hydrolase [Halofilum sp. (in: g-proteobacteria)]|nr:alpha/beta fold hydrolase [Halofilum sp. (in: g-proteobacteria)]
MELHTRVAGNGPPLVLLHGLFGSNENLGGVARALADRFTIYGMDLRNHGRSPHADSMDYADMAADVRDTLDAHGLDAATVLGHSLGGKTAMELALSAPERVSGLVVVDIAPIAYDRRHDQELEALHELDLSAIRSRGDADAALADRIPNPAIRQFLLKNLSRTDNGFTWRIPLETIYAGYAEIAAAPPSQGPYNGPALFIRGGNSDYLPEEAEPAIRERFPDARIETIPDAAHWVHVDAPEAFLELF